MKEILKKLIVRFQESGVPDDLILKYKYRYINKKQFPDKDEQDNNNESKE